MKKNLLKKAICVALTIGMMASVVTGCGDTAQETTDTNTTTDTTAESTVSSEDAADTADTADSGDVTEITFWYAWKNKIEENNLALTEEFNETVGKEKGIHVTAEYQGTYAELHQKLQEAYVAGEVPDITVMEDCSVKNFQQNGVIDSLDSYIDSYNVDVDDFQDALMLSSYIDGECYGLPYLRSTPLMYYNKTMLEECGLDPDGLNTWDDLAEYAKVIYEKTGHQGISMWSYIWSFEGYMFEENSSILSEDETTTNINTDAGKRVVNYYKDLIDAGYAKCYLNSESDKVTTDVVNQDCGIWISSTANLSYNLQLAEENGFELGATFFPMDECYGVPTGGCLLVLPSNESSEKQAAAWEFMYWLTSTEQSAKASINTGYLPSRKSAAESDDMQALYEEQPLYKIAVDQLEYSHARPSNPNYAECGEAIVEALDAIWVNGEDVDSTLADIETKANKILQQ